MFLVKDFLERYQSFKVTNKIYDYLKAKKESAIRTEGNQSLSTNDFCQT